MNLLNKTVLLTGASGGIGQALARELAHKGARLYLVGRNEKAMSLLKNAIPHPERHNIALMRSYSDEEILGLANSLSQNGGLDILINNAGSSRFALLEQQSFDDIREQIRTNIEIPALLTRALLDKMNRPGIVLNIGSIFGEIGHPAWSVYSATKAATHRFSEALGRELQEAVLPFCMPLHAQQKPRSTANRFTPLTRNSVITTIRRFMSHPSLHGFLKRSRNGIALELWSVCSSKLMPGFLTSSTEH
jgi:short-subunit dehydrogenase